MSLEWRHWEHRDEQQAVSHSGKYRQAFEEGTLANRFSKLDFPCAFSLVLFEGRAVGRNFSLPPRHLSSHRIHSKPFDVDGLNLAQEPCAYTLTETAQLERDFPMGPNGE